MAIRSHLPFVSPANPVNSVYSINKRNTFIQ